MKVKKVMAWDDKKTLNKWYTGVEWGGLGQCQKFSFARDLRLFSLQHRQTPQDCVTSPRNVHIGCFYAQLWDKLRIPALLFTSASVSSAVFRAQAKSSSRSWPQRCWRTDTARFVLSTIPIIHCSIWKPHKIFVKQQHRGFRWGLVSFTELSRNAGGALRDKVINRPKTTLRFRSSVFLFDALHQTFWTRLPSTK